MTQNQAIVIALSERYLKVLLEPREGYISSNVWAWAFLIKPVKSSRKTWFSTSHHPTNDEVIRAQTLSIIEPIDTGVFDDDNIGVSISFRSKIIRKTFK
jgi:hypothetical protein